MSTRLRLEGCPAPACDDLLFAAPVTTSYKLGYSFNFWKSAALQGAREGLSVTSGRQGRRICPRNACDQQVLKRIKSVLWIDRGELHHLCSFSSLVPKKYATL